MCERARDAFIVTLHTVMFRGRRANETKHLEHLEKYIEFVAHGLHTSIVAVMYFCLVWYSIEQYQSVLKESCLYAAHVHRSIVQLYDTRNEHE